VDYFFGTRRYIGFSRAFFVVGGWKLRTFVCGFNVCEVYARGHVSTGRFKSVLSEKMTSIPWTANGNSAKQQYAASQALLYKYSVQLDTCPTMQLAMSTMVSELLFSRLRWVNKTGDILDARDVAGGWETAVCDCVRAILVSGMFFWRSSGDVPTVAHPSEVWIESKGWKLAVMYPPFPRSYRTTQINSPVASAFAQSIKLEEMQALMLNRDRMNSKPGVFIAVDSKLQNATGRSKPWFRSMGSSFVDTIGEQLEFTNQPYDYLVQDRADIIEGLGDATMAQREKKRGRTKTADNAVVDGEGKQHREHVLTDGYEGKPAAPLQSLADGLQHITATENKILYAMQVPPPAVGRNINTERLASANQLVMYSLRAFKATTSRLKRLIGKMLKEASENDDGDYITFSIVLSQHDLDHVEPLLTPAAIKKTYSQLYDIPENWLDLGAIKERREMQHSAGRNGDKRSGNEETNVDRQVKRAKKAPPKSDTGPSN
jgi:hypothetical protein